MSFLTSPAWFAFETAQEALSPQTRATLENTARKHQWVRLNRSCSIYQYSNLALRLFGQTCKLFTFLSVIPKLNLETKKAPPHVEVCLESLKAMVCITEPQVEVSENEKRCGNTSRRHVFPQFFGFSQTFVSVSMGFRNTENMFSISFRKHRHEKTENNLLTLDIKM